MALLVLGGQGAIRLLVDPSDSGLLGWVPGGFAAWLCGHVLLVLVGAALAAWAQARSKAETQTPGQPPTDRA